MYEKLVEALRLCVKYNKCRDALENAAQAADVIEELSKLVDESIPKCDAEIIIAEVAKPRWIPVTERLPPKGKNVLVYVHSKVDIGYLTDYTANGSTCWVVEHNSYESLERKTVKAWMPLPTPPKEEKDELQ